MWDTSAPKPYPLAFPVRLDDKNVVRGYDVWLFGQLLNGNGFLCICFRVVFLLRFDGSLQDPALYKLEFPFRDGLVTDSSLDFSNNVLFG